MTSDRNPMTPMEELREQAAKIAEGKAVAKFWSKVDIRGDDECWLWLGQKVKPADAAPEGYGRFYLSGRQVSAHRYSYTATKGEIPDGLVIDHLCRNRSCVNPNHLEAVTNHENILRGVGFTAKNAVKTHCKYGHELTAENLEPGRLRKGWRECRTCKVEGWKRWKAANPRRKSNAK